MLTVFGLINIMKLYGLPLPWKYNWRMRDEKLENTVISFLGSFPNEQIEDHIFNYKRLGSACYLASRYPGLPQPTLIVKVKPIFDPWFVCVHTSGTARILLEENEDIEALIYSDKVFAFSVATSRFVQTNEIWISEKHADIMQLHDGQEVIVLIRETDPADRFFDFDSVFNNC